MSGQRATTPGRTPALFWLLFAAALAASGGVIYLAFQGSLTRKTSANKSLPKASGEDAAVFAAYGKSPSCKSCHEEAYRLWENSHHALAERLIDPAIDAPAFASHFRFSHGTQQSYVQNAAGKLQIVTTGIDGNRQAFTPERVLAVNPLRQFLVPAPGGRYQATELAYDPNHPDWFNVYGEEDRKGGEWGHWTGRGMTWNVMCAACHNTRVRKNYDEKTDSYRTTMAERGVGCEACHGPMKDHNEWQALHPKQEGDPTIRKLSREQMFAVCGSCHSRRSDLTGDFHPGENYFDHYALSIPDETDLFYPDGQIRDEDFELTAFLGSRMHASGVRCMDCHEGHGSKLRISGNNMCMVCHAAPAPPAPKIDLATHSHHQPGGRGDQCVACHMPQTVYMQRHSRHDHGFTIPDPVLTKEFGIPNACNRCHTERDADWSIDFVDKWYGEKMNRPTRERTRIMARAKQGDPKSPAELIAVLKNDTNGFWRAVSATMLRRWVAEPDVRQALVESARDPDPQVRSRSLRALEPFAAAGEPVLSVFEAGLKESLRTVRLDAAWGLRRQLDTNSPAGRDLWHHLGLNADQPSGALQQGVFQLDRGNLELAMAYFRKAVSWDTNSAPLHHALALGLSMQGKSAEAVESLRAACRLAPSDAEYRFKLGLALNESGRPAEALEALEQAVILDPQYAQAWYNLGLACNAAGQIEKALSSLIRAESIDHRSAQIPYARATILARMQRIEEARVAARRALELDPGNAAASELLEYLGKPGP